MNITRTLIALGLGFILLGLVFWVWQKLGLHLPFKLFQLPGDFVWRGDNWVFYFPLTSGLLISLVLNLLMRLSGLVLNWLKHSV